MSVIHEGVRKQQPGQVRRLAESLELGMLAALVVGSMVGSGVISLPQNMVAGANARAIMLGC